MKATLKVLSGGNAGKELKLKEGQFLIGRSDSCHLRPRSDGVSRKHCVLFIEEKGIRVRDLKSRNGTLRNGEKIEGDVALTSGDKLAVGPLEFQVNFSVADAPLPASAPVSASANPPAVPPTAPQKSAATVVPKPKSAQTSVARPTAAAAKAKSSGDSSIDDDIFSWLEEGDEVDREQRLTDPGTRQFKADGEKTSEDTIDITKGQAEASDTTVTKKKGKPEKKEPGKLPPPPDKSAVNSQAAAADALKQFFKRS